jgi:hypothetical protein
MVFLSDFNSAFIAHLRRRFVPHRIWSSEQVSNAEEIAAKLESCHPIGDHMDDIARSDLVDAINVRDYDRIEGILDHSEKTSMRPWCVAILKVAISLAMGDAPTTIRTATTNLIGIDVMWE